MKLLRERDIEKGRQHSLFFKHGESLVPLLRVIYLKCLICFLRRFLRVLSSSSFFLSRDQVGDAGSFLGQKKSHAITGRPSFLVLSSTVISQETFSIKTRMN